MKPKNRRNPRASTEPASDPLEHIARLVGMPGVLEATHFEVLRRDVPYHQGTTARVLGEGFSTSDSGLLLPSRLNGPRSHTDYVRVFLTLNEYTDFDAGAVARWVLDRYPAHDLLMSLAVLNRVSEDDKLVSELQEAFIQSLNKTIARNLRAALSRRDYYFIARQPVLDAMLLALAYDDEPQHVGTLQWPDIFAAVLLTHAVAALLGKTAAPPYEQGELLGGWPTRMVMSLVQNAYFNQSHDPMACMVRYHRLWTEYASQVSVYVLDPEPLELLQSSLGLSFTEFMALGYALFSHAYAWKPGNPRLVRQGLGVPDTHSSTVDAFLRNVSLPFAEHRELAAQANTEWSFLAFRQRPVVDFGEAGLLVLDSRFMLERITSELWRFPEDVSGGLITKWRQFYGEAVELMTEDQIAKLSPRDLATEAAHFFTEEDFKAAYQGQACDAAICYGVDWCLFEVVTTRMPVAARELGDPGEFIEGTRRIVLKKARQLDQTARQLLDGLSASLSGVPTEAGRVFPIVVTLDDFPWFQPTARLIGELLDQEALLQRPRVQRLSLLGLGDIDLLEALLEQGHSPVEVLAGWHESSLAQSPFVNFVLEHYGPQIARPTRVEDQFETVFEPSLDQFRRWGVGGS